MSRFNIAFVPLYSKDQQQLIHLAQSFFGQNFSSYLLGDDSIPHITLCQLEIENNSLLTALWNTCQQELNYSFINTAFKAVDLRLGSGEFRIVQWISLIPSNQELPIIHYQLLQIIQSYHLNCLNAHGQQYFPHLTLANVDKNTKVSKPDLSETFTSKFFSLKLSIGIADQYWQYQRSVFS